MWSFNPFGKFQLFITSKSKDVYFKLLLLLFILISFALNRSFLIWLLLELVFAIVFPVFLVLLLFVYNTTLLLGSKKRLSFLFVGILIWWNSAIVLFFLSALTIFSFFSSFFISILLFDVEFILGFVLVCSYLVNSNVLLYPNVFDERVFSSFIIGSVISVWIFWSLKNLLFFLGEEDIISLNEFCSSG